MSLDQFCKGLNPYGDMQKCVKDISILIHFIESAESAKSAENDLEKVSG